MLIVSEKEVLNMGDDFEKMKAQYKETFGKEYVPKGLTEEEKKELYDDYARVFSYDPDEEEVKKRYSKEFNDWIENS